MTTPEAVVRRFYRLAAEGDREAISELLDPGVVWFGTKGGLDERRVSRGVDSFLAYLDEIAQPWEEFRVELQHVIEFGDVAIAFGREMARARGALDLQNETAMVFKVRDGKIVEARGFLDRDEALETVGLRR